MGDRWKLRAQGWETRYETFCRHNGLLRVCVGCGVVFTPWRRDQKRCVAGCRGPKVRKTDEQTTEEGEPQ